jgi:hypothetical protein
MSFFLRNFSQGEEKMKGRTYEREEPIANTSNKRRMREGGTFMPRLYLKFRGAE